MGVTDPLIAADVSRALRCIADDLRSAGDVPLVRLDDDGVTQMPITLADELWLLALRLDPEGTVAPHPAP